MGIFIRCIHVMLFFLCIIFCAQSRLACADVAGDSQAHDSAQLSHQNRLSLARDFVSRLKKGMDRADSWILPKKTGSSSGSEKGENVLPEGELLLLQPILDKKIRLDGVIAAEIHNQAPVISLRDFADVLRLAIDVAGDGQSAEGWYIREQKTFSLDFAKKEVVTDHGHFNISGDTLFQDNEIFVPPAQLGLWLGLDMEVDVAAQALKISGDEKLPIQEEIERKNNKLVRRDIIKPSLPLGGEEYTVASVPIVDVSTRSTYRKRPEDERGDRRNQAYINTAGDFAKGTLKTQTSIDDERQISRVRATYHRDSLEGDLLGGLEAKRFEAGDVTTVQTPLGGNTARELGVRVTNTDPRRTFTRPTTVISGNAIPGWDVELYRNTQYLGIINIDESGFYSFDDVILYQDDNNFRLVFYGPQGERHEETVFVPFDRNLLTRGKGIYDVSLSFDGKGTYIDKTLKGSDPDSGSMNISALYEKPLGDGLTGSAGFRSNNNDGKRDAVGIVGLSLIRNQALINADVAVDDEGDAAAELSVRRDFGDHGLSYIGNWRGANFDDKGDSSEYELDVYKNALNVNGPLPFGEIFNPNYYAGINYEKASDGDFSLSSNFGVHGNWRNISVGADLRHATGSSLVDDTLDSTVNVSAGKGKNNVRVTGNYEIEPDARVESLSATYSRRINNKLDFDFSVTKDANQSLVEYESRLDWQAGFVRISPSISYDTNDELYAGLSTRFGFTREPVSGDIKMFDRSITNHAFASAFVYMDKNGDGEFNGDDEPLEGVVVTAPQNGRREVTGEDGIALFSRMINLRLTDVFVDKESLPDPAWIPGFEGVSILPRQGYVARIEFPIHMSGEIDGTVYAKVVPLPEEAPEGELLEGEALESSDVAQIEPASGVAPEIGEEQEFDSSLEEYQKDLIKDQETADVKAVSDVAAAQPVPLRNIELLLYNDMGEVEQEVTTDIDGFYYFSNVPPGRYYLMISEESARRKNIIRPKPEPIEITYEGTLIYDHKIFVDMGEGDIPSEIVVGLQDYKERHPHVSFDDERLDIALNLGEYNSRLLMSLVWYKLRSRYGKILGEKYTEPMVLPTESYADVKTGKHTLRIGLKDKTLDEAYSMCRSLIARELYCKVEIMPTYMSVFARKEPLQEVEVLKIAKATEGIVDLPVFVEDLLIEEDRSDEEEILDEGAEEEGEPEKVYIATVAPIDITGDSLLLEEDDKYEPEMEEEVEEEKYEVEEYEDEEFVIPDRFTPTGEYKNISKVSKVVIP